MANDPTQAIVDRAIEVMATELRTITVANSYNTEVKEVRRDVISGETARAYPFINLFSTGDTGTETGGPDSPVGFQTRIRNVTLEAWISGKGADLQKNLNNFVADIIRAVKANYQLNDGVDDLASDVIFDSWDISMSDDRNNQVATISVIIRYRTNINNPYNLA